MGDDSHRGEYEEAIEYISQTLNLDIVDEYLVDGAILSCEKALCEDRFIDGCCFHAKNRGQSRLAVNRRAGVIGQPCANIIDTKANRNIFPFGNCKDELTKREKDILKNTPDAREEGICKYLMRLSNIWDIFPEGEKEWFRVEGYPAITKEARLFCLRGAFIYPITSGQEVVRYKYEDTYIGPLSMEEMLFAYRFQLNEEQLVIFKEIRDYYQAVPDLANENVIFAFEGLGSYEGATNKYHQKGQYGAIFVYCKEGQIIYACDKCSTLPDTTYNATIKDGIYAANYHNHHRSYVSLQLVTDRNLNINDEELNRIQNKHIDEMIDRNGQKITEEIYVSSYRFRPHDYGVENASDGIDLHTGKGITETSTWSVGCLTVAEDVYYELGVISGFIDEQENPEMYKTYEDFKDKLKTNKAEQHWGYIVINREYMEAEEREVFLPDYEEENNP